MEKVIIVGSGPAGYTAAIYCARANLEPLMIDGTQPGGQLTTTTDVENYPGFPQGVDGTELVNKMREQAERFGTRFEYYDNVAKSDFSSQPLKITLESGTVHEAKTVIICTGASARYLGLESEQALMSKGVTACATCDGAFYKDMPVAVIGGGDTAMEEAIFLTRFASKVTLIHRRDEFRASKIMSQRVLEHDKIDVVLDTVIDEVMDVALGKVTGLKLRNVKTDELTELAIDGLFLAIGHTPNTQPFVHELDTDENGYLVTNNTRTNIPGVYAAGDVQDHEYRQAVTAAGTGCMAALEAERFLEAQGL